MECDALIFNSLLTSSSGFILFCLCCVLRSVVRKIRSKTEVRYIIALKSFVSARRGFRATGSKFPER